VTAGPEPTSKGKGRSIRWSARVMRDREEIAVYIARDNPQAAHKWIANLRKTAERAAEMALVDERTASLEIGLKL